MHKPRMTGLASVKPFVQVCTSRSATEKHPKYSEPQYNIATQISLAPQPDQMLDGRGSSVVSAIKGLLVYKARQPIYQSQPIKFKSANPTRRRSGNRLRWRRVARTEAVPTTTVPFRRARTPKCARDELSRSRGVRPSLPEIALTSI